MKSYTHRAASTLVLSSITLAVLTTQCGRQPVVRQEYRDAPGRPESGRRRHLDQFDNQLEKDSAFAFNVGRFGLASNGTTSSFPILTFRWKHTLKLQWNSGAWGSQLTQNYNSSYEDQNLVAAQYFRRIEPYKVWNWTNSYNGIKHVAIVAGVTNLLDAKPPLTNHSAYTYGYLSSAASPIGRAFNLRMTYTY